MFFSGTQQWWTRQEKWSGTNILPSFLSSFSCQLMNKMEKSLYFRDTLDSGRLTKAGARSPALMKKKNGKGEYGRHYRHYRPIQHPVRAGQLIDSWLLRCRWTSSAATTSWYFLAGYDMMARTFVTILQPWWEG